MFNSGFAWIYCLNRESLSLFITTIFTIEIWIIYRYYMRRRTDAHYMESLFEIIAWIAWIVFYIYIFAHEAILCCFGTIRGQSCKKG